MWKDVHNFFVSQNVCSLGMCYVADHFRRYFNKKKVVTNVGERSVSDSFRRRCDKFRIDMKLPNASNEKEGHVWVDPACRDKPVKNIEDGV